MSKELFVSSTPHETKVAIVEEDQLAEIYFERENEYTLAGSIYKGRVTRVLPGMQSAFVDIGLERDAFLYVTDFFEQDEEEGDFETLPAQNEGNGGRQQQSVDAASSAENGDAQAEFSEAATESGAKLSSPDDEAFDQAEGQASPGNVASPSDIQPPEQSEQDRGKRFGRRRRGRRGRGFPEAKFDREPSRNVPPKPETVERAPERKPAAPQAYQPIILPGESISKYRNLARPAPVPGLSAEPSHEIADGKTETGGLQPHEVGGDGPWFAAAATDTEPAHELHESEAFNREQPEAPPRRPTEEIDVVSILQKHAEGAAQKGQEPAQSEETLQHRKFGFATGVIEEEEIEEEESEHPGALHAMDDEDYEDLEEETLEVGVTGHAHGQDGETASAMQVAEHPSESIEAAPAGQQFGNAESATDEVADYSHEADFEEEDLSEDGQEEEAGQQTVQSDGAEEGASAEVRGPTGYQQKVGFDRNRNRDRGRRGGRRMRNAPRGRKFNRGPLPQIADLLKEGQEVLIQIAKEPIGKKGARITSHIALPGRFLVYMPTVNHNGVSRKISSEEERQRLKRIILSERQNAAEVNHHGGFIVRTVAASASEEDLRADIRFLLNLWSEIKGRADSSNGPTLIYHDLNLVERVLRDQVSEGFSHLWIDSEQEYERVLRFISRFQPSMLKRVKLYTKETPLFEEFNIQEEINKALKSKVWLKSGGYIVINQTEALVAIDVNTGKYVGKTQKLEDTIVKTNVDAIKEIVRQIRLRDLGGIIVIDFIDMDERRNRQKVMQALEEALKSDRAPSKVLQFNDFGLVAITRKRVKQSLERTLGSPCTYCTGTGLIKSVATVCNEIYVEMRKLSKHLERGDVIARVNPEVGKALKANNARWLQDMEELTGKTVIVKPDPTLHQEQFDIH